jgi:hypothetical protein
LGSPARYRQRRFRIGQVAFRLQLLVDNGKLSLGVIDLDPWVFVEFAGISVGARLKLRVDVL